MVFPMSDAPFIRGRSAKVWERDSRRLLSEEDLRQIAENVTGYFCLLDRWAQLDRGGRENNCPSKMEGANGKRC